MKLVLQTEILLVTFEQVHKLINLENFGTRMKYFVTDLLVSPESRKCSFVKMMRNSQVQSFFLDVISVTKTHGQMNLA